MITPSLEIPTGPSFVPNSRLFHQLPPSYWSTLWRASTKSGLPLVSIRTAVHLPAGGGCTSPNVCSANSALVAVSTIIADGSSHPSCAFVYAVGYVPHAQYMLSKTL